MGFLDLSDDANEQTTRMNKGMAAASASDTGEVRARNEDAYLEDPERRLYAVADGIGGHPAGDEASRLAIETIDEFLTGDVLARADLAMLGDALREADRVVREAAAGDPQKEGMGTTAVLLAIRDDRALIGSVGDSRAYRLHDGKLQLLTTEHVEEGPGGRFLTQAIGSKSEVDPALIQADLAPGDRLLLCTDGLTDLVDEDRIAEILINVEDEEEACGRLVEAALASGGEDNVTVVIVTWR